MFIWCNYNAILITVNAVKPGIFDISKDDFDLVNSKLKLDILRLKNCKILLTGGTGFFGKWILGSLLNLNRSFKLNLSISVLSRNPINFFKKFPNLKKYKELSFIKGNIINFSTNQKDFTHIIHGATDATIESHLNIKYLSENIVKGTQNILDFASKNKINNFLFISSGSVYGKQMVKNSLKINEKHGKYLDSNDLGNASGILKKSAELLCNYWASECSTRKIKIARCFAFVGPWLPINSHFAIGNFINSSILNNNIIINSDGASLRSYLYTSDLVIWLLKILILDDRYLTINVGSDQKFSIKEIAILVKKVTQKKIKIIIQKKDKSKSTAYVPDIRLAKSKGLKIYTPLEKSILKTYNFYKEH